MNFKILVLMSALWFGVDQEVSDCDYVKLAIENEQFISGFHIEPGVEFLDAVGLYSGCRSLFSAKGYVLVFSVDSLTKDDHLTIFKRVEDKGVELSFFRDRTNDLFFFSIENKGGDLKVVKTRRGSF